jgi:hypothetical protein
MRTTTKWRVLPKPCYAIFEIKVGDPMSVVQVSTTQPFQFELEPEVNTLVREGSRFEIRETPCEQPFRGRPVPNLKRIKK